MRRSISLTVVLVIAGVGFVAASAVPGSRPDDSWVSDVLMSVGSGVLLFGPFYFLTQVLDRHITKVEEEAVAGVEAVRVQAQERADEIAGTVDEMKVDLERRLEDVSRDVRDRLAAESEADQNAFEQLRVTPSHTVVGAALARAIEQGLIDYEFPPRVEIAADLWLSAWAGPNVFGPGKVTLRLEGLGGEEYRPFEWVSSEDTVDVMVSVGRVVEMKSGLRLDPARFFNGLADLLQVAASHPARRPAIQLFPPQWVLTTHGAVRYDGGSIYQIGRQQLVESQTIASHVATKTWADADAFDEAQMVAISLFADPASG